MTTLLIADDHPLFREALRGAVQRVIPGVQLFEADSVEALYALADQHNDADLVLMDLNMPGAQGFNALVHMRSLHPHLPVVVVSAREEATVMRRALDRVHGASPWLLRVRRPPPPAGADAASACAPVR